MPFALIVPKRSSCICSCYDIPPSRIPLHCSTNTVPTRIPNLMPPLYPIVYHSQTDPTLALPFQSRVYYMHISLVPRHRLYVVSLESYFFVPRRYLFMWFHRLRSLCNGSCVWCDWNKRMDYFVLNSYTLHHAELLSTNYMLNLTVLHNQKARPTIFTLKYFCPREITVK